MGEAIVFTSGKGGVGKTTTIANIGAGLSRLDKKVIMLDTDMGLRNLDVVHSAVPLMACPRYQRGDPLLSKSDHARGVCSTVSRFSPQWPAGKSNIIRSGVGEFPGLKWVCKYAERSSFGTLP